MICKPQFFYVRIDILLQFEANDLSATTLLYVRIDSLLTSGKHLHNCISSLNWSAWVHKTSLTPPLFIAVPIS